MSDEITYLDVPQDAASHAARFGAQPSSTPGRWFVVGSVHRELLNYLPRFRNQAFVESIPACPVCGNTMRKRSAKDGNLFWACASFYKTGCQGTIEYQDYLDAVAPVSPLSSYLPELGNSLLQPDVRTSYPVDENENPIPQSLREKWAEVVLKGVQILRDEHILRRWLSMPKREFKGKTPYQMMVTENGCSAVLKLLDGVWS